MSSPRRKASGRKVFDFAAQMEVGELGQRRLTRFLREKGYTVEDVSKDADWQRRDVDMIVNGRMVECKTDVHSDKNLFFEVECGGKAGCFYKSRAEWWCVWFPTVGKLYIVPLPEVQYWLIENAWRYTKKIISSGRGKQRWSAWGFAIPIADLLAAGIKIARLTMREDEGDSYVNNEAA